MRSLAEISAAKPAGVRPRGLLILRGVRYTRETLEALAGLVSVSIDRTQALEDVARVQAAIRRRRKPHLADSYRFAECEIDFKKMTATRKGTAVALTSHEFRLLKFFTDHAERVLSREELLNEVWGYNCYPTTRTVDNQILKLRQKLESDPANPTHFLTIYGAGYKFVP